MKLSYQLIVLLLSSILMGCQNQIPRNNHNDLRDSLIVEYMSYVAVFYDDAFIDWDAFTALGINQNLSDWTKEVDDQIHPSWRENNLASLYWDRLQSAKICLHCKSLSLRSVCDEQTRRKLDAIEKAFDEAFVEMVSQEYYLRVFQDVFDEVFSERIDEMVVNLK